MAAFDPYQPGGGQPSQPGLPQAQSLPQAAPADPQSPLPQAQPVPQGQPVPQAQPIQPTARPVQPGRAAGGPAGATGVRPIAATVKAGAISGTIRTGEEEAAGEEDIAAAAIQRSPPWLVSAVVHMVILIALGLWFLPQLFPNRVELETFDVSEEDIWAEELGQQLEVESMTEEVEDPVDALALTDLPEVDDPFAAPPELEIVVPDGYTATSDIDSRIPGLALHGREEGSKRGLLGKYGGTRLTEEAVLLGLEWLARQQLRSGGWSLAGPFTDGVPDEFDNHHAATAMALLAFQGAGNTAEKGRFKRNVASGWNWLLKEQDANGNFYHEGAHNHHFYTHGQCTIAICELYGMTRNKRYKDPAMRALDYCLKGQSAMGGWRYDPAVDSDVSVTGWIVMALQSARMAGLEVPDDHFRRVERYLDQVARHDGARYPYQKGGEIKLAMTAEALLMRQYLGWPQDHPALVAGLEWITSPENLVSFDRGRDVYFWYYATQAAHHMEGDYWKRWNGVMRQSLPEMQVKRGREAGSWDPERPTMDQWTPHGGRLYVTCLSIYMLEVYYRHLPIYTNVYADMKKSPDRVP